MQILQITKRFKIQNLQSLFSQNWKHWQNRPPFSAAMQQFKFSRLFKPAQESEEEDERQVKKQNMKESLQPVKRMSIT